MAFKHIPIPDTISTAKTTRKLSSILINWLVTNEIGSTSRGKYIFFTKSCCAQIHPAPPETEVLKKIHGTKATKRNK